MAGRRHTTKYSLSVVEGLDVSMLNLRCPICGAQVDEALQRLRERLSEWAEPHERAALLAIVDDEAKRWGAEL